MLLPSPPQRPGTGSSGELPKNLGSGVGFGVALLGVLQRKCIWEVGREFWGWVQHPNSSWGAVGAAGPLWVPSPAPRATGGISSTSTGCIPLNLFKFLKIPSAAPPPCRANLRPQGTLLALRDGRAGEEGRAGGCSLSLSVQGQKPLWNSRSIPWNTEEKRPRASRAFLTHGRSLGRSRCFQQGISQLCPPAQRVLPREEQR